MSVTVSKFIDVSEGLKPNQFSVGEKQEITSISDLDETYKQLMDKPYACVMAVMGKDGRPNLTPMWFDYEGDKVLINVAAQRRKTEWIRNNPEVSILIMNPENMYHWLSIKVTVEREILEDDPEEGSWVTEQLNRIWQKYIGEGDEYGLRDPAIEERRVLFECKVDRIATFGQPG
ncbi:MAG: PPOX class F420-dependent oxidoreductase [Acidimicrobiales bacterium]